MQQALKDFGSWWCRTFHTGALNVGPTHYECRQCFRLYPNIMHNSVGGRSSD